MWFSFGSILKDIVSDVRVIYMIVDGVYSLNLIRELRRIVVQYRFGTFVGDEKMHRAQSSQVTV